MDERNRRPSQGGQSEATSQCVPVVGRWLEGGGVGGNEYRY